MEPTTLSPDDLLASPPSANPLAPSIDATRLASSLDSLWGQIDGAPAPRARHLGDALLERHLVDRPTLNRALNEQRHKHPHRLLGQLLVDNGVLSQAQLNLALAEWLGVRVVDPRRLTPEPDALARIPPAIALRETVLPLMVRGDALVVAVPDPWDQPLLESLRFVAELRVVPVIAVASTLAPAVAHAYGNIVARAAGGPAPADMHALAAELAAHGPDHDDADATVISESDNALVRLVNRLIAEAVERRASDIHIETAEPPRPVRVRMRIDGELVRVLELPSRFRFALIARLKIMADLDISEHRKPQDGKIDFARFGGAAVELRVVTVPTVHGREDVVLRLLSGLKPMPLDEIGLSERNLAGLRSVMSRPYGLILICGPTGCGKTTTLHSVMRELNTEQRNIWTAEDPVEIAQEGLRQVQVNARIGWTFAAAMRTFLRADPDIIMIGEMRDEETARIAVEASLTGHLVMSTLHTNTAVGAVTRLRDMGVEPFLLSSSLIGVLAQRLVRVLDPDTRIPYQASEYECRLLNVDPANPPTLYKAPGEDGYAGRTGIYELVKVDNTLRTMIHDGAGEHELERYARTLTPGIRDDGVKKILAGITTLEEVLRVTRSD